MLKNSIGIIAVLVVVVGGGILAYQYSYITKKEQPNIQTQTNETPETETPAPITESSDWKKYTDNNFGYSFYYPKTWKVSSIDSRVTITNFGPTRNEPNSDSISISEVQDSKAFVTDSKFGNTTLYYDDNLKQWMKTSPGANEEYKTKPAKVAFNTISGLSVYSSTGRWKTVIIPLSHTKFLVTNITGSGYTTALDLLASAITEANANISVGTIEKIIADMMEEDELATGPQGTVAINSLSQNSGPAGTQITIYGKGFLSVPSVRLQQDEQWQKGDHVTVSLVSYPNTASAKSATIWIGVPSSDTSITLTIPVRACGYAINPSSQEACKFYTIFTPGTYSFSVNAYGQQRSNELQFTITGATTSDAPVMTSLDPSSGSVGTQVTIRGYNFTGREGIDIGNVPLYATPSYVSSDGTQLIFPMPSSTQRSPGNSYPVTLTASNGSKISNSLMFNLTQ
jgi:hypothetical protein